MGGMRILIIENDVGFQEFLKRKLEEQCFIVDAATDGLTGLMLAHTGTYDVIIIGETLPDRTGCDVTHEIRKHGQHTPIIMTAENADVFRRIDGLKAGVDDYISRPCYFDELLARIGALLRRPPRHIESVLAFEDLTLDVSEQRVRRGKVSVYLTRKEFALLEYFMRNPGRILTRQQLFEHVWSRSADPFSNTIETHILNIRKKIHCLRKRRLIHSVTGRGYKLDTKR